GRFDDDLTAITSVGSSTWSAIFTHPGTGNTQTVTDRPIAANEILLYAGGRDLGSKILGVGEPGGFDASGTPSFLDAVEARGESGGLGPNPTDFGPWGG